MAPYCQEITPNFDFNEGKRVLYWLSNNPLSKCKIQNNLFCGHTEYDKNSNELPRSEVLKKLTKRLKKMFKKSTGLDLVAPLEFEI